MATLSRSLIEYTTSTCHMLHQIQQQPSVLFDTFYIRVNEKVTEMKIEDLGPGEEPNNRINQTFATRDQLSGQEGNTRRFNTEEIHGHCQSDGEDVHSVPRSRIEDPSHSHRECCERQEITHS